MTNKEETVSNACFGLAKIKFSVDVEKTLTGETLGEIFCNLNAKQQAIFFEKIHKNLLPMQLEYMQDHLSDKWLGCLCEE